MTKIFEITGKFSQYGQFAPNNQFHGYVELENKIYNYQTNDRGKIVRQHFKGIQIDQYDEEKIKRLVFGGIQIAQNGKVNLFFYKIVNNDFLAPINYGLESNSLSDEFTGEWLVMQGPSESDIEFGGNAIVNLKEVKETKEIREFLESGYEENKSFPLQMRFAIEQFETDEKYLDQLNLQQEKTSDAIL